MLYQLDQLYSDQDNIKIYESMNTHQFYTIQVVTNIYEASNTPYEQIYEKQTKNFIDSFANTLRVFQEKCDQISKQEEEELQNLREKYHDRQHKILLDSSANELKVSRETADNYFK